MHQHAERYCKIDEPHLLSIHRRPPTTGYARGLFKLVVEVEVVVVVVVDWPRSPSNKMALMKARPTSSLEYSLRSAD